jgi:hypothetical protein
MYYSHDQVFERQKHLLDSAAEQRTVSYAKRLSKAARRAERAERQLSRSWREAAQRHAELHQIAGYGPSV